MVLHFISQIFHKIGKKSENSLSIKKILKQGDMLVSTFNFRKFNNKWVAQLKVQKQVHISVPIFSLRKEIIQYLGKALEKELDGRKISEDVILVRLIDELIFL